MRAVQVRQAFEADVEQAGCSKSSRWDYLFFLCPTPFLSEVRWRRLQHIARPFPLWPAFSLLLKIPTGLFLLEILQHYNTSLWDVMVIGAVKCTMVSQWAQPARFLACLTLSQQSFVPKVTVPFVVFLVVSKRSYGTLHRYLHHDRIPRRFDGCTGRILL